MGGDFEVGEGSDPLNPIGPNTDMIHALDRLEHIEELLPEICTLDCGSLNFGDSNMTFIHTPAQLRAAAKKMQELQIKPEMEAFEMGHLWFANQLYKEGLIDAPPLYQICLGIPWGAPATTASMKVMADMIPKDANWAGFGIGRHQMSMAAQSVILGGNVMVMNGAQLGIRTSVHQNQVIGSYSMIGMNSIITKKKIGFYNNPLAI